VADPVQRVNFFDHQFLHVEDFLTEQAYHVDARRRHNRGLHTPGIAYGLRVSPAGQNTTAVTVGSGMAIDSQGREIVVIDDKLVELGAYDDGDLWLVISYQEAAARSTNETGVQGATRMVEDPLIEALKGQPAAPDKIVVALVRRGVGQNTKIVSTVDESPRRLAGSIEGDVNLTPRDPSTPQAQWVTMSWSGPNRSELAGSLSVKRPPGVASEGNLGVDGSATIGGALTVGGTLTAGGALAAGGQLSVRTPGPGLVLFDPATNQPYPGNWVGMANNIEGTKRWLHVGGIADIPGDGARRLALFADRTFVQGSLGAGVVIPRTRLDVQGQALFRANPWPGPAALQAGSAGMVAAFDTGNAGGAGFLHSFDAAGASTRLWFDGNPIIFAPRGTERARFGPNGEFMVGTTTPNRSVDFQAGSEINTGGPGAGWSFQNRENAYVDSGVNGSRWVLYSSGGTARLWANGDKLTVRGSDGFIGIGTDQPQAKLHVVGGAIMPAIGNAASAGIYFPINPGGGGGDEAFIRYYAESGETTKLLIGCQNDPDDRISLYQANAERLVVYNGCVGIGTVSPPYLLTVWGTIGYIGLTAISDETLKKNVRPVTDVLDRVRRLRAVGFEWRKTGLRAAGLPTEGDPAIDGRQLGLLAQEVQEEFPDLVTTTAVPDGDPLLALDYSRLSVVLLEAVKELADRVDALEARLPAPADAGEGAGEPA